MKILVINCGSSSIKYKIFSMEKEKVLAKGQIERIGDIASLFKQEAFDNRNLKLETKITSHDEGISFLIDKLLDKEYGVLKDIKEISGVGHRVLHGGNKFKFPVLINDDVKKTIKECSILGPLHNPNNLKGIEAIEKILPDISQVASFDTAFHQTMPEYAYLYAIPYEFYEKDHIRKYGFHGSSHRYITQKMSKLGYKDKFIICHLGNGCSISAIKNSICVDTSMGFTPLEGLIMGTRSGDIDPSVIFYLSKKYSFSLEEIENILNKRSGILGISEFSNDMRDLVQASLDGNKKAKLAIDMFVYRIKKYIGSYYFALDSFTNIVFTGGIGENNFFVRKAILEKLENIGINLDENKNESTIFGKEGIITTSDSKINALVLATDEELMIARDTKNIILGNLDEQRKY